MNKLFFSLPLKVSRCSYADNEVIKTSGVPRDCEREREISRSRGCANEGLINCTSLSATSASKHGGTFPLQPVWKSSHGNRV